MQTQSDIKRFSKGSSLSNLSRHLSENDDATAIGCGRLFRADYLSARGKWIHLGKLLTVILFPILGGWVFTLYSLADNVIQKDATVEASVLMTRAISLGRLIYTIQKERDMSTLYISRIGPGTKTFLLEEYDRTDKSFVDMWDWPLEFAVHSQQYFRTKRKLINHINTQRNRLDPNSPDVYGVIRFYSEIVEFMMEWMIERIRESGFGNTWKSLVVFQKITRCMLDTGVERAYGTMFYAQGNFPDVELYDSYFRRIFRFNYNYKSSTFYSDLIDPLLDSRTDQVGYTIAIRKLRDEIKTSNFTGKYTSVKKAEYYFDNATFRVDYLYALQEAVASRVVHSINSTVKEYTENIIVFSLTASIVILACPFIMAFSEALTSNMHNYSKILEKASDQLNKERNKTDILVYQMLPKPIADRLKRKSTVKSEFFKSATVMFTSVVDFVQLSIESSPLELIELLNILYSSIDEKIEKYDVYKVETINDTYMVVSGVPTQIGSRHASEISYLALDISFSVRNGTLAVNAKRPIHLLIGVSTGSVSAGVVGTVMLRYCLFGDTVNTASRMRSYGQPNRIHISEPTYRLLKKTGSFQMTPRGSISIKVSSPVRSSVSPLSSAFCTFATLYPLAFCSLVRNWGTLRAHILLLQLCCVLSELMNTSYEIPLMEVSEKLYRMSVQGKGEMNTFWLKEANRSRDIGSFEHQLPGEVDDVSEHDSFTKAHGSRKNKRGGKKLRKFSSSVNPSKSSDDDRFSTPVKSAASKAEVEWAI